MERLTSRCGALLEGTVLVRERALGRAYFESEKDYTDYRDALEKLATYEDTGLEPKEVKAKCAWADNVCKMLSGIFEDSGVFDFSHIKELITAEQEGRLIVLPCKVGDTVYKPLGKNEEILPIKIQWFETNNYGWCACGTYPPRATYAFRFADLGKTWFTDRAEAEKAMEVREDA